MKRLYVVGLLAVVAACQQWDPAGGSKSGPAAAPQAPAPSEQQPALPPGHPPIGGAGRPEIPPPDAPTRALQWKEPAGWKKVTPSSQMRHAQYVIPKAGKDTEDAELVVFYFGQGQGGSIEENVRRWAGQFGETAYQTEHRTVGTLPVTLVSLGGTYSGGMAMGGGPAPVPHENWALLGAIAETPDGPWFFKLTGPRETLTQARPAFDQFVGSFRME